MRLNIFIGIFNWIEQGNNVFSGNILEARLVPSVNLICRQHASIYWSSPTPYEDKLIEIEINSLSVSTSLYLESHGKIPEMVHIMQKKNIEKKNQGLFQKGYSFTAWFLLK